MMWLQGLMLGSVVWVALKTLPRLSAAERFQVWLFYLLALPLLPFVPAPVQGAFTITANSSVSKTMQTAASAPNLYWIVAGLLGAWALFKLFAAWGIWSRACGDGGIRCSDEIHSPVACAWGILLPWEASEWNESTRMHVLRHEKAHLDRADAWVDAVASLLVAACWLQPFAWLALAEMRRLRELAADDAAVLAGSDVFEYAETIHQCAVQSTLQPAMAGGGHGRLEERMQHLLHLNVPRRRANWLTATLAALALGAVLIVLPRVSTAQEKPFDVAPKVTKKIEPQYTDGARERKVSGTVVLSARIDTDGKARDLKVIRALDVDLDTQAMRAVEQWVFEPGKKDGVAVTVRATIEVNFRRE